MARRFASTVPPRFGTNTFPFRLPLSINRTNETIGQTVEQAIADNAGLSSGIDSSRVDPVLLPPMRAITQNLNQRFVFQEAIGVQNTKVDFIASDGPMGAGTVSVKSSYRGDKVCPQVIGQTTKERYMAHFGIPTWVNVADKEQFSKLQATAIKKHFLSDPALVCDQMLQNLNCCDYIIHLSGSLLKTPASMGTLIGSETSSYLDRCKNNKHEICPKNTYGNIAINWLHKSILAGFVWDSSLFSFTKTLDTWNESCTIKYNGISIAEFQIHNNRNVAKFRFKMKALLGIIQSEMMSSTVMTA